MEEDRLGMQISGDVAEIEKDSNGVIGVSIGGGAPYCPCIYVVQVFENSSTDLDGRIQAGDEIISINGLLVKGEKKTTVARMIQKSEGSVKIGFNILHPEPFQGHTLDIALKKMKHRVIESMASETADALGLSRAMLCNDLMLQKLNRLEHTSQMYKNLIKHLGSILNSHYHIANTQKEFGDLLCEIAARESSTAVNLALSTFGNAHRILHKNALKLLKSLHSIVRDLNTFVDKAIPDTKLTAKKYLDAKFEYLSFCLKLKEMDDEEMQAVKFAEPLYRIETGNYEYRLMLRCRQNSREKFIQLRKDVLEKLELLDQKHAEGIKVQMSNLIRAMMETHEECKEVMAKTNGLFPFDIDLGLVAPEKKTNGQLNDTVGEPNVIRHETEHLLDLS